MIQEIIPGGGECQFSFAAACLDGKVHAFLTARRTRQIPMDFGRASTFVETMDVPEIIDPSTRMIADIGLTGLVEIEFKQDPRTNKFKLLDVNSRSWGWHSIAAAAGVDFPYLVWQLAQGEEVEFAQGRAGVRWVRLTTDLSVAGREVLGGRIPLRTYLKSIRPPVEGPVSAKDDPLPTLMELPLLGRRFVNRVRHKLRFTKKPAPAT
jgi:D-aspartate ligase